MLVATNRNLVQTNFKHNQGNESGFGEELNAKGPNELRFAEATKSTTGKWTLDLVPEPAKLEPKNLPSKDQFERLAKKCISGKKNCVFFIHGYNKPFVETLEQAWLIQERYDVEVVLFSWPSNTGGFKLFEYRHARRIAQTSFGALDSLLEKYSDFLKDWLIPKDEKALLACHSTTNLIAHSLGNYLLENYVLSQAYQAETRLFTNIVLSQADVNNVNHVKWVDQIVTGQRIYITINENDKILGWSESLNPPRLGKTISKLESKTAQYFDFTSGKDVGNKHKLWGEIKNATVKDFFSTVLNGRRGDSISGFTYNAKANVYQINQTP